MAVYLVARTSSTRVSGGASAEKRGVTYSREGGPGGREGVKEGGRTLLRAENFVQH